MKILAIVVTYYPNKELLLRNVASFEKDVEKILIWENTPAIEKESYRFLDNDKVVYCGDGVNSISRALNYGWRYARDNGYNFLLTMDQDSEWVDFEDYKNAIPFCDQPLAIFGPSTGEQAKFLFNEVCNVITSGTLIPIKVLDIIGGYCEQFPIDGIDWELGCRANQYGIKSYMVGKGFLKQQFGCPKKVKILGKVKKYSCYSPSRRYNTAKSKIMILRKFDFNLYFKLKIVYSELFCKSFEALLFDDVKYASIKAIWTGVWHGMRGK